MQGRWTIRVDAPGEYVAPCAHCERLSDVMVPVVPSDDAAIERAERWMLNEMHEGMTNRECVESILRAAGETPERAIDSDLGWPECGCKSREGCWCGPDPRVAGETP